MRIGWIWLGLGLLYAAFFGWYTSFGGPLSEAEIARYLSLLEARDPPPDAEGLAVLEAFMRSDTGDDFAMVNVIQMRETPQPVPGVAPGERSDAVLGRYMAHMYPALLARASHPVLYGEAASPALDLLGAPGMERWTRGAAIRYRSRRDLMDIVSNPEFFGAHDFKLAAMQKTIAFPIDPWLQPGDPRLLAGLVLGLVGCALSWRAAARSSRSA
jgi:hypothetical protein